RATNAHLVAVAGSFASAVSDQDCGKSVADDFSCGARPMPNDTLSSLLGLTSPPVAISFVASPPDGVPHVAAGEAAGCGYWRRAPGGEVFYTSARDPMSCPVAAHPHGVALPADTAKQLQALVMTMVGLEYLKESDVPQIPTLTQPFRYAIYAPLDRAPV